MASSEYIGLIKCAICGNDEATVHKQIKGSKRGALYYRCYTEINGATMQCGTIQCLGFTGQKFIKENVRPIGEPVAEPEQELGFGEPLAEPKQKKGFLETIFGEDNE